MDLYQKALQEQEKLRLIIKNAEQQLINAPPGRLRISKGKRITYYHCSDDICQSHKEGKYIPKKDSELAVKLAQKDYLQSVLTIAKQTLNSLQKLPSLYVDQLIGSCYA